MSPLIARHQPFFAFRDPMSTPATTLPSALPPAPLTVRRQMAAATRRIARLKRIDRAAVAVITLGGLAVIVAVLGILLFIGAEAVPLFRAATVIPRAQVPSGSTIAAGNAAHRSRIRQRRIPAILLHDRARRPGRVPKRRRRPAGARATCARAAGGHGHRQLTKPARQLRRGGPERWPHLADAAPLHPGVHRTRR